MNFSIPCSEKKINQVFFMRKKVGNYKSIPLEIKSKMMDLFLKDPYPPRKVLENFSKEKGIPLIQVQNWFKYQRKRDFYNGQKAVKKYKRKHKFEKSDHKILENAFRQNVNLSEETLLKLQKELNCQDIHIKRWFYYRNKKLQKLAEKKSDPLTIKENSPQENFSQNFSSSAPTINNLNTINDRQFINPINPVFPCFNVQSYINPNLLMQKAAYEWSVQQQNSINLMKALQIQMAFNRNFMNMSYFRDNTKIEDDGLMRNNCFLKKP